MRQILTGHGIVTSSVGKTHVEYRLRCVRSDRPGTLVGMVGGLVLPVSGKKDETLTLETEDGLTVKFSYLLPGRTADGVSEQGEILVHNVTGSTP